MSTEHYTYTEGFNGYLAGEKFEAIVKRLGFGHPRHEKARLEVDRGYCDAKAMDRATTPVRS